jgi:putative peptide zinc metalloprotease protein
MNQKPSAPLRVRLRPDLIAAAVESPRGELWHLKDPLALRFYQFDGREYGLLRMLDGTSTIDDVLTRYHREFAPHYLSARQLLFFIDDARRNGLLLIDRPPGRATEREGESRGGRWSRWMARLNVLSIKLPGIDPDRWLDALYPLVRWFFSPAAVALGAALVLAALALVLLRFEEFVARLPDREQLLTPQSLLWLGLAIGGVKVLHELAHAFACKHFGGECHELGLMLLVFVPCLYCNVSDSWLLAQRRERMWITAAGMCLELVLAVLATFVWWFAIDGPVRTAALSIMVVGSLNTLLLNGNPLMRYDGYYLFSDLVRVPNLAAEASQVLRENWRRWGLGIVDAMSPRADQPRRLLALYGVASFVYRLTVSFAILLALHALGREYKLQVLAWMLTLLTLVGLVMPVATQVLRPFLNRTEWRRLSAGHVTATAIVLGLACGGLFLIPLPHSVRAPFIVEPEGAERIFVKVPGTLLEAQPAGARLKAGDLVARLGNPDLELQFEALTARQAILARQLESYLTVRGDNEDRAALVPATRKALADVEQQIETLQRQLTRLELRTTQAGEVLAPPNVVAEPAGRETVRAWHGTPLDAENLGAFLEAQTLVCLVGEPNHISATILVDQQDVPFVRPEQPVELLLTGRGDEALSGVVAEVSAVPMEELPREIAALKLVPIDPTAKDAPRPLAPVYRVRVRLDKRSTDVSPVRGTTGDARIRLAPEPLGYRLWRGIQETFRFEL